MSKKPRIPGEFATNAQDVSINKNSYNRIKLPSDVSNFTVFDSLLKPTLVNNYTKFSKNPSNYLIYDSSNNVLLSNYKYEIVSCAKNSLIFTITDSDISKINIYQPTEINYLETGTAMYINTFSDYAIQVNSTYDTELSAITNWSDTFVRLVSRDVYIKVKSYNSATYTLNCEFSIAGILSDPADVGSTNGIIRLVSKTKDISKVFWKNVPVFNLESSPVGMSKSSIEIDNNAIDISIVESSTYPTDTTIFKLSIITDSGTIGYYDFLTGSWTHSNDLVSGNNLRLYIEYTGTGDFNISTMAITLSDSSVIYLDNYNNYITTSGTAITYVADDSTLYYNSSYVNTAIVGYKDRSDGVGDYFRKRFYGYGLQQNLDEPNFVILRDNYSYTNDNILARENDTRNLQLSNDSDVDDDDNLDGILVKQLPSISDYISFGATIDNFEFYTYDTFEAVTGMFTLGSTALTYFQLSATNDSVIYYARFTLTGHIWKFTNSSTANRQLSNSNLLTSSIPLKDLGGDTFLMQDIDGTEMSLSEAVRGKMLRRFSIQIDKDWDASGEDKPFIIKNDEDEVFNISKSGDITTSGDIYNNYGEEIGTNTLSRLTSLANSYSQNESEKIFSRIIPEQIQGSSLEWWSYVEKIGTARYDTASFSLNNFGYTSGGNTGSRSDITEKYNDSTNLWSSIDTLNTARDKLASFSLNSFGYTIGGFDTVYYSNIVEKYNDIADAWSNVDTINIRSNLAGFSFNGFGYSAGGLMVTKSDLVEKYNDSLDSWTTMAALAAVRSNLAGFSLNNFGYVFGGNTGSYSNVVERYNETIDAWSNEAVLNTARENLTGFSLNNFGYVAGGNTGSNSDVTEKYNSSMNLWKVVDTLNTARRGLSGFNLNNSGYVVGGYISSSSNIVEKLSIKLNYYYLGTIYSSSNPPTKVLASHASEYFNDGNNAQPEYLERLQFQYRTYSGDIISSGNWVDGYTNDLDVPVSGYIDPVTGTYDYEVQVGIPERCSRAYWKPSGFNAWTTMNSISIARNYLAGFSFNGFGYVAGGSTGSYSDVVEKYNDNTNSWSTMTALGIARYALTGFDLNSFGYVAGGSTGGYSDVVEKYNDLTDSWDTVTALGTARMGSAGFNLNEFGYVAGGYVGAASAVVEKYNNLTNAWSTMAVITPARRELSGFSLNGFGYVAGGYTVSSSDVVEKYNDNTNSWSTMTALGTARYALTGFDLNSFGYVAGGYNGGYLDLVEKYNDLTDSWDTVTALGTARTNPSGFNLNSFGYVAGGHVAAVTDIVEKYSDLTQNWPKIKGFAIKIIE